MLRAERAETKQEKITWFHQIDLGDGNLTDGFAKIDGLKATADVLFAMGLENRTVLDVGAWDGYYSFEAEKRGAARVLAADHFCWSGKGWGTKAGFDYAHRVLNSRVDNIDIDIPDMTVDRVGKHDIVLFNGIWYHVFNPLLGLELATKIANHVVTVETFIDNCDNPRPVMNFFPGEKPPPGYPENGWGPNSILMHAIFKRLGYETTLEFENPGHGNQRSIFLAFKPGHPFKDFVEMNLAFAKPRVVPPREPRSERHVEYVDRIEKVDRVVAPDLLGWRDIAKYAGRRIAHYFK